MTSPSAEQIRNAARNLFSKGRCSGHEQFNGRYCRDAAEPERWCIRCVGFMLLALLDQQARELETWREWAQFVYKNGGPVEGTDNELRAAVCAKHDTELEAVKAELANSLEMQRGWRAFTEAAEARLLVLRQEQKQTKDDLSRSPSDGCASATGSPRKPQPKGSER